MYLTEFTFPDYETEAGFRMDIKRTCYDSYYPFGVLSRHNLTKVDSEPVEIRKWTELPNVREYYDFFYKHRDKFKDKEQ